MSPALPLTQCNKGESVMKSLLKIAGILVVIGLIVSGVAYTDILSVLVSVLKYAVYYIKVGIMAVWNWVAALAA